MPKDHRLQIASYLFKFDIVTGTVKFNQYLAQAIAGDYVRDVTDESLSNLNEDELAALPFPRYINVVQKSDTWLILRSRAQGTASSVGKYVRGPTTFPSLEQIKEAWLDKINKKPFQKTHTMLGHMNWGVGYEDPALIHLALEEEVGVAQVGTIRVDLDYILALGKSIYGTSWIRLPRVTKNQHLLISPDGIVGKPVNRGQSSVQTTLFPELYGMLEIKCMSPFYHIETEDHFLQWVDDIESRQWHFPQQIPFVYITQMTLQAISGAHSLKMGPDCTMWFMRWSPHGFSVFKFKFRHLIRMGVLISNLYFSLVQRIKTEGDVEKIYPLQDDEAKVEQMMLDAYEDLMKNVEYKYVKISDYPEFDLYHEITKRFLFKVPEIDPETLQVKLPRNNQSQTATPQPDLSFVSTQCLL